MSVHPRRTQALVLAGLLLLGGCGEEPPIQNDEIDDGGVYEDGSIEEVAPVEPEVVPPEPDPAAPVREDAEAIDPESS